MRIVDLSPRLVVPPRNGSSLRIYHLMRHLSTRHEIRQHSQPVHSQTRGRFEREVRVNRTYTEYRETSPLSTLTLELCFRSWITTPVLAGAVLQALRPGRLRADLRWADVCVVEFPWQFAFCRRERPDRPVVYVAHNVEVDTRATGARGVGIDPERSRFVRHVAKLEREALAAADLIVAVSPDDKDVFLDRFSVPASRLVLVPNGSDTDGFVPVGPEERHARRRQLDLPDRPTVLFAAAIPKPPDRVGLAWIKRVAARMPEISFLVVGGVVPRPFREANVIATGLVDDVVPYFQASDVSLCPIEHGGGTKIKVWDSLAAGLPTVAFAETMGSTMRHGEQVWIVDKTEDAIVTALERLLHDSETARRLGAAARAFVVASHDWGDLADDLETALLSILN